jgi:CheY-like chemotaxis protein
MKKRVLVVDDAEINRILLIDMLERAGWEAEEAVDGMDALSKLQGEHGFNLIMLDIKMPGMSGEEVCCSVRSDLRNASLPLVAYTAHALEEEWDSLHAIGFDAILTKPINMAALKNSLTQAFKAHGLPVPD